MSVDPKASPTGKHLAILALGAIGVVYGDIGTSPLYALKECFIGTHGVAVTKPNVLGVLSLIFWSLNFIVTFKYLSVVMRADNQGEGGILALLALVRPHGPDRLSGKYRWLVAVGLFGAALLYGDGIITPAISVLGAVEGLSVATPALQQWIVPIAVVIISALFAVQRRGTAGIGAVFGPVTIVWFICISVLGVMGIMRHPSVLVALNPWYAATFLWQQGWKGFMVLSAVVLVVTGAEALYADMGHFGRRAITRGWLFLVLPACTLSYLGQGALILKDESNISSPFFLLVPDWGRLPLVLLATAATVIASQAVITGAYSVASQAAQLGYLPRLRIAHTSPTTMGQVYVPWINWLLFASVLTLIFAFRSSAALAYAYGMTVTGTISITTLLFFYVAHYRWNVPKWLIIAGATPLLAVDLLFVGANLTKIAHGAWLPLLIALIAFTIMTTWQRGRAVVTAERERSEGPLREFIGQLRDGELTAREVPGTAIFLNRGNRTAPLALRANVQHNQVRHAHVVILSIETEPVPRVAPDQRAEVDDLGFGDDGITYVTARFGYMETPDVPAALATLHPDATEGPLDLDKASYFLSKIELRRGEAATMATWRKHLFIATSHITADAAEFFNLPRDRTVIIGSHIEV